jgi:hypothetical protein
MLTLGLIEGMRDYDDLAIPRLRDRRDALISIPWGSPPRDGFLSSVILHSVVVL